MPSLQQQPVPKMLVPIFQKQGIRIKNYQSVKSFEKELVKFLKRNHVLHLGTCKENQPRVTPVEYRIHGLRFYILSEGGGKFKNLKDNKAVCFSIAEQYDSDKDFLGNKGLQAWGTAKIYSRKKNPGQFKEALKKMKKTKMLRKLEMKEIPADFNYRVIEIRPDRIKYGNPREGVLNVTWKRK